MQNSLVDVQFPKLEHNEHSANIAIKVSYINGSETVKIEDVFKVKGRNSYLVVENYNKIASTVKVNKKKEDSHILIELAGGASVINLDDLKDFATDDKSLELEFAPDFKGSLFVISDWKMLMVSHLDGELV